MSHTKRTIEAAAEVLGVPVDELTWWLAHGEYRPMPPHGAVASHVTAPVYRAADSLNVHPLDLDAWLRWRERQKSEGKVWGKGAAGEPGWLTPGPYAEVPKVDGESVDDELAPVSVEVEGPAYVTVPEGATVGLHLPAGKTVEVARHSVSTYRLDLYTSPHLVSEDDYRGVASDFIARWADGHADATRTLAALNLASVGMPVTTPSRRAVDDVRDLVTAWRDGDLTPQDAMDAIARRVEA